MGGRQQLGDEAEDGGPGQVENAGHSLRERVGDGQVVGAELVREEGGVHSHHQARAEAGSQCEGPHCGHAGGDGHHQDEGPGPGQACAVPRPPGREPVRQSRPRQAAQQVSHGKDGDTAGTERLGPAQAGVEVEGQVEAEVGVSHSGGGHGEDTEPQPRVPEHFLPALRAAGLAVTDHRPELGVGVEEGGGDDVQDDGTEEQESSSVAVPVHHHGDQGRQHEAPHGVAGEAEAVRQAAAGACEPFIDLQHAGDGAETAARPQEDAQPDVEVGQEGEGGDDDTEDNYHTASDTHHLVREPFLQSDGEKSEHLYARMRPTSLLGRTSQQRECRRWQGSRRPLWGPLRGCPAPS